MSEVGSDLKLKVSENLKCIGIMQDNLSSL